ncbi:aminotransferase class V-fold PLP-dependent enzyme [Rossellomorea vietnamensis]|uniref:Aminotransferase class V-fold PLP-dependent enzyme n=1 Tax=Rossellomorea vietnamensis TaxID=218284 RepID=A0ACD4C9V7_9BACI|nr:aminotransferase class V-fold PLP-dependent enzyme [Rossellomorea vietnamensis]UXH45227.1 aminotransferase class V-fold PLP-dependent enzyme [Rossellomorea vietnamensis]
MNNNTLHYKIACEADEFQQIYALNYQTFVEEIPQHEENDTCMLVDKFHDENTYVVAKADEEVVGMIAVRSKRPFSLDQKLDNLDEYLPDQAVPCEVRLLSVKEEYRSTRVFYQLCDRLVSYCLEQGFTMALISGTVRQLKLYKRIGFLPFAELVGEEEARFQPMYLTRESFENSTKAFQRLMIRKTGARTTRSFLPGPVSIHPTVEAAFKRDATSHRSSSFLREMEVVRKSLRDMTGANHVQVAVGTGTLANDIVAAQLKRIPGKGLILSNGEFGSRLMDHGKRFDLSYHTLEKEWNDHITIEEIETVLQCDPGIKWLWTVHCETSTGYLYKIIEILSLCQKYDVELCIDACSSVGTVPVDFNNVFLATSVSGKGLGSYPGLALIFHREIINPSPSIPRYLDVGMYASNGSVPYTHSSNLLAALKEAFQLIDYDGTMKISKHVRRMLADGGFQILGGKDYSPGVITLALNREQCSRQFGDACKSRGILLSYESEYLIKRNWVQVALMGEHNEREVLNAMTMIIGVHNSMIGTKVVK